MSTATPQTSPLQLDPRTYARGLACVHCGLCLPACPTYTTNFNEADSPRGRIQLMLALSEGRIEPTDSVRHHLDLCLDCRACETACPSGVVYHELIEEMRARLARQTRESLQSRLMRWSFFHILTRPTRMKLAMLPGRLLKRAGLFDLLPGALRKMGQMLPSGGPLWPKRLPRRTAPIRNANSPAKSPTVVFFPGCVGSVMYDSVNRKAIDLLAACGAEVIVSHRQVCCGAIHHHNGAEHRAMELARQNIDTMLPPHDPPAMIVTDVAGCGAMLREYDFLLRDDPAYSDRARAFVARVRDISEALLELGLPEMKHPVNETITYHDACHLAHAQKVVAAPRRLLAMVPGLRVIPLPESDMCCGAAGTYNLTQPGMATDLANRKLDNIASTGAERCAAGNVGCAMHIQAQARERNQALTIVHPIEILHRAVFGDQKEN